MSGKQNLKEGFSLNNCFLDLQRAAVSFYFNPKGKTHQIFLKHARKILEEMKSIKARKFSDRIFQIEKATTHSSKNRVEARNLADKMLTLGLLLKRGLPTPGVG